MKMREQGKKGEKAGEYGKDLTRTMCFHEREIVKDRNKKDLIPNQLQIRRWGRRKVMV